MSKFYQIQGPFKSNEEIVPRIKSANPDSKNIERIGIHTREGNKCRINNILFQIGRTGILEFNEVEIISLVFLQNETNETTINCTLS